MSPLVDWGVQYPLIAEVVEDDALRRQAVSWWSAEYVREQDLLEEIEVEVPCGDVEECQAVVAVTKTTSRPCLVVVDQTS